MQTNSYVATVVRRIRTGKKHEEQSKESDIKNERRLKKNVLSQKHTDGKLRLVNGSKIDSKELKEEDERVCDEELCFSEKGRGKVRKDYMEGLCKGS